MKARQTGAALIIALVIVAIATILAATLVWENHLDRRRTALQLHGAEALANALSVEDFLRDVLAQDDAGSDHLQEPWARQGDIFPIEGGSLTGNVSDLQGRFNLNSLINWQNREVDQDQLQRFRNLLGALGIDERLADQVVDWIDADIEPQGFAGAEDDAYLRSTPAYRTANGPVGSVSELRLLANMTPEQYAVLEPYVTALPVDAGGTPHAININTAAPELLVALGMSADAAARIVETRNQAGLTSVTEAASIAGEQLDENLFGVTSAYFRLQVLAVVGSSRVTLYSVLHRNPDTRVVRTLSRSLGTF